ncbi:unnamed protein product [Closterium sp. Yama58-4]|nr:unnamed protein product [Closterium sp. Yama58-4]
MKALDAQGVILHSLRTKVVEFQTKYPSVREKSAASIAAIHLENQKRIQTDVIKTKELEVEEALAVSDSHLTALAARLEDHIKRLSSDPDLTISDVAKEKFRKIKVQCIERARCDIATAKDDIKVQELLRQKSREAEELKKSAAAEEMVGMEPKLTIDEIVQKQVQKAKVDIRKELKAEFDAALSAKLKSLELDKQDVKSTPAAANPKPNKAKKKRGGKKKKADVPADSKGKGLAHLYYYGSLPPHHLLLSPLPNPSDDLISFVKKRLGLSVAHLYYYGSLPPHHLLLSPLFNPSDDLISFVKKRLGLSVAHLYYYGSLPPHHLLLSPLFNPSDDLISFVKKRLGLFTHLYTDGNRYARV